MVDQLTSKLSKLALDWGSLVAVLSGIIAIAFFVFGIIQTNAAQQTQIVSLQKDVGSVSDAIPKIERSLGRIEGKLGIFNRDTQYEDKHRRVE